MADDRRDIETALQTYLDGLYEGDAGKLAATFHETSALTHESGGTLTVVPRAEWLAAVEARPSPRSQNLPRHDEIVTIDQSSPTTAFAKVKCAIPPRFFTDYLSLVKIDGRWKVAQKVFAVHTEAEAGAA